MICPGLQAGDYYALAFRPWLLKSWLLVTCHVEFRGLRTRQPCPYRQSDVPEHGRNACHVVDTAGPVPTSNPMFSNTDAMPVTLRTTGNPARVGTWPAASAVLLDS